MNLLVLAPHPDDETIGCGGALLRQAQRGDRIVVVFLTSGELGLKHLAREEAWAVREREAACAARILGVAAVHFLRQPDWFLGDHIASAARALRPLLRAEQPRLIYTPHPHESHPDHQAALPVLRAALRGCKPPRPEVRAFEVWTPLGQFDHIEDVSALMPRKLRALRAYRSQLVEFDYLRAAQGLNAFRGVTAARVRYAEVFQTISLICAQ